MICTVFITVNLYNLFLYMFIYTLFLGTESSFP